MKVVVFYDHPNEAGYAANLADVLRVMGPQMAVCARVEGDRVEMVYTSASAAMPRIWTTCMYAPDLGAVVDSVPRERSWDELEAARTRILKGGRKYVPAQPKQPPPMTRELIFEDEPPHEH